MVLWERLKYNRGLDWIDKISCLLCTLYCIIVFIVTIRLFFMAKLISLKQQHLTSVYINKIAVLSICVLLSYIISCFTVVMNHWNVHSESISCATLIKFEGYIYCTSKFMLYIFLTFRVDIAFDNSTLRYKKYLLHLIRIISIIMLVIMCAVLYFYLNGILIQSKVAFHVPFCQSIIPMQVAFIGVVIDSLMAAMCLSLFGRKIYQASTIHHCNCSEIGRDEILINTFRKNAVLAFVAIISTFILIFISTFGLTGVTIPLDCCINASCVFLMFARSQLIYSKLCGKCEHCISDSLLAKFACICSQQHLKKISKIHVNEVKIRNHNHMTQQRSNALCEADLSSLQKIQKQRESQSMGPGLNAKCFITTATKINEKRLTPIATTSSTPQSLTQTFETKNNEENNNDNDDNDDIVDLRKPASETVSDIGHRISHINKNTLKQITPMIFDDNEDNEYNPTPFDNMDHINSKIQAFPNLNTLEYQYTDIKSDDVLIEENENISDTENDNNNNNNHDEQIQHRLNCTENINVAPIQLLKSETPESMTAITESDDDDNNGGNNGGNKRLHIEIQIDNNDETEKPKHGQHPESLEVLQDEGIEPSLNKKQSSFNPLNLTPLYEPQQSNRSPSFGSINIENREMRGNTLSILADEMMMIPDLDIDDHSFIELSRSIQPGTETNL